MILLKIRDHLKAAGQLPLRDIASQLSITQNDAQSMLEHWVKKGVARKLPSGTLCEGSCRSCSPDTIEIYEWVVS